MAVEMDGEAVGFGCSYTRVKELHILVGSIINMFRFYRFDEACGVLLNLYFLNF